MDLSEAFRWLELPFEASKQLSSPTLWKTAKRQYRKLSHKYHPDKGGNEEDFVKLSRAFEVVERYIQHRKQERTTSELFDAFRTAMLKRVNTYITLEDILPIGDTAKEMDTLAEWYDISYMLKYIRGGFLVWFPENITYFRFTLLYEVKAGGMSLNLLKAISRLYKRG